MQDAEARKNEGSSAKLDSQIVKKEERLKEVVKDVHKKEFGSHRKDAKGITIRFGTACLHLISNLFLMWPFSVAHLPVHVAMLF